MIRYKVKIGDFMGMSTVATNLSEDNANKIADEERIQVDGYTLVEVEPYEEIDLKFGR